MWDELPSMTFQGQKKTILISYFFLIEKHECAHITDEQIRQASE